MLDAAGSEPASINKTIKQHMQLVVVVDDARGRVLLGRKKRGFGEGYYNGFGGARVLCVLPPQRRLRRCLAPRARAR